MDHVTAATAALIHISFDLPVAVTRFGAKNGCGHAPDTHKNPGLGCQ